MAAASSSRAARERVRVNEPRRWPSRPRGRRRSTASRSAGCCRSTAPPCRAPGGAHVVEREARGSTVPYQSRESASSTTPTLGSAAAPTNVAMTSATAAPASGRRGRGAPRAPALRRARDARAAHDDARRRVDRDRADEHDDDEAEHERVPASSSSCSSARSCTGAERGRPWPRARRGRDEGRARAAPRAPAAARGRGRGARHGDVRGRGERCPTSASCSWRSRATGTRTVLPSGLTLDHVRAAVGHDMVVPSIGNSLRYVTLSTAFDFVVGTSIAWLVVRTRSRVAQAIVAAMPAPRPPRARHGLRVPVRLARATRSRLDPVRDPTALLVIAYADAPGEATRRAARACW